MRGITGLIVWAGLACGSLEAEAQEAARANFQLELLGQEVPSREKSAAVRSDETQPEDETPSEPTWQPRLRVEFDIAGQESGSALVGPAGLRTTARPAGNTGPALLRLDEIDLSVTTTDSGELRYSFTTEGPFELQLGTTRVVGSSVSLIDGALIATEASITTAGDAVFTAEKLELRLGITGVRIRADALVTEPPAPVEPAPVPFGGFSAN